MEEVVCMVGIRVIEVGVVIPVVECGGELAHGCLAFTSLLLSCWAVSEIDFVCTTGLWVIYQEPVARRNKPCPTELGCQELRPEIRRA